MVETLRDIDCHILTLPFFFSCWKLQFLNSRGMMASAVVCAPISPSLPLPMRPTNAVTGDEPVAVVATTN